METVHFFLIQLSFLAVVLVLHTYIGLHVIRRTLIFSDLVLDQLAAFGAMAGIALGVHYGTPLSYGISTVCVIGGAYLLAAVNPRNPLVPREAAIGIMYAAALVACLLLADKIHGGSAYVTKTLSGSLLWVTWPVVAVTAGVYVVLLLFHYRWRERFIALTERPGTVTSPRLWDFLFFATQGIITVLVVPVSGVLLAYAFLMIPAATALLLTRGWKGTLIAGWSMGFGACAAGTAASYFLDLPYGPTLVSSLSVIFGVVLVVRCIISRAARPGG